MPEKKRSQQKTSELFHVAQRTVSQWKKAGAPVYGEPSELAHWIACNINIKAPDLRASVERFTSGAAGFGKEQVEEPAPKVRMDPDKLKTPKTAEQQAFLEEHRDFAGAQLQIARKLKKIQDVKFWSAELIKAEKCIREAEAHAKKLGIDRGEMLAREEVERIIRATMFAGNACVAGICKELAKMLSSMDDPGQIYDFLRANILGAKIFEGFSKVSKAEGPTLIPGWFIDAVQSEGEQYLSGVKVK